LCKRDSAFVKIHVLKRSCCNKIRPKIIPINNLVGFEEIKKAKYNPRPAIKWNAKRAYPL
jgi:hypothetical protein